VSAGSVAAITSSTVTPGASSTSTSPSSVTSMTARSVMMRSTTPRPVSGSEHSSTILAEPSRATCSMRTMTFAAPWTRSMAPPGPLTILPGIIQLARSPAADTCMAPRIAASILPPRIMPKLVAESKYAAPGSVVTVSLPALMRSGSTRSSVGYGPTPRMPFSDCSTTVTSSGT
jgi:hypothetical protein